MEDGQKPVNNASLLAEFTDNVDDMGARYTGRILDYQGEGSPDSYGYVQII